MQSEAKARLAATNTFRQRLPPYAGPRVRGYRAQEVRFSDKVDVQDTDLGSAGFLQGGGLAPVLCKFIAPPLEELELNAFQLRLCPGPVGLKLRSSGP